jgi:hypothetical protein
MPTGSGRQWQLLLDTADIDTGMFYGFGRVPTWSGDDTAGGYVPVIIRQTGTSMPAMTTVASTYGTQPGAYLQTSVAQPRVMYLQTAQRGADFQATLALRAAIIDRIKPDRITGAVQPMTLRYTGGTTNIEISGVIETYDLAGLDHWLDMSVLRFFCPDPFFRDVDYTTSALSTVPRLFAPNLVAGRDSTGGWSSMANGLTGGNINSMHVAADGTLYAGGSFTTASGTLTVNGIASWNGSAWSALSGGLDNGTIKSMITTPDGTLYAAGSFTSVDGDGTIQYVASWNGSAWSAVGNIGHLVEAITVAPDGTLFAAGFDGSAAYLKSWNGTSWSTLGTSSAGGRAYNMTRATDGTIYVCGSFSTFGGTTAADIASYDGSAWSALGSGISGVPWALTVATDGTLYAGGDFLTAGGVAVKNVARWNGSSWSPVSDLSGGIVYDLFIAADGTLFAAGSFDSTAGRDLPLGAARWTGGTWLPVDARFVSSVTVDLIRSGSSSVLYIGGTFGASMAPGDVAGISYNASAAARTRPIFEITNNGSSGNVLYQITNYTTGHRLWFDDLQMLADEVITLDLSGQPHTDATGTTTTQITMVSSHRGDLLHTVLPHSDLATFVLQPGSTSNWISVFAQSGFGINLKYKKLYWGVEGSTN